MTVVKASTAMVACVSIVPLDRNRRMIGVAAICAWRSARTSIALMAHRASVAVLVVSLSPIAPDASRALLWATLSCLRQAMRVCSVALAANRMPTRLHASRACRRRTRSGTALTAPRASDARLVKSPTRSARAVVLAWVSTRRTAVSVWTASPDTSHRVYRVPLDAQAVVTSARCISRIQDGSVARVM